MRFSLKLFSLVLVLSALLVAYEGVRSKTKEMKASSIDQWHSFNGASGARGDGNGGIAYDGSGQAIAAEVRSAREFSLLIQQKSVPRQLRSIGIFGPETFQAFDPDEFPNIQELSLAQIFGTSRPFAEVSGLKHLKRLRLADHEIPLSTIADLNQIESLEHLHIWTDTEFPIEEFPEMKQISLLVITAPNVTESLRTALSERLPGCEIVFRAP